MSDLEIIDKDVTKNFLSLYRNYLPAGFINRPDLLMEKNCHVSAPRSTNRMIAETRCEEKWRQNDQLKCSE
jgi:hypothetical protein